MKPLFRVVPLLLSVLWAGCALPHTVQYSQASSSGTETTKLIIHAGSANRAFADQLLASNYLTLELKLVNDRSQRSFASSTKDGSGNFVVTIPGLVAGDWRLRAFFYDGEATGNLILYARQTEYLAPGQVRSDIVLTLHTPSNSGPQAPATVLDPHHLILDPQGALHTEESTALVVGSGTKTSLFATVYSDLVSVDPAPLDPDNVQPDEYQLATEQAVVWTTSDPEIAVVSASGKVTALEPGRVIVTARSVDNQAASASYHLKVVPGLVGGWKNSYPGGSEFFRFEDGRWAFWVWSTYINPESEYDAGSFGFRGTYVVDGDNLRMVTDGILLPGAVEWIVYDEDSEALYDVQENFTYRYAVNDDVLALVLMEATGGGDGGKTALDSGSSLFYSIDFTGRRVTEDPLTSVEVSFIDSVTVAPDGSGNLSLEQGTLLDLTATFGLATVDQLVWTSSDTNIVSFVEDAIYSVDHTLGNAGTVELKAYALGTLDYPAASLPPPVVTLYLTVVEP